MALKKSNKTGRYYTVESLKAEEKLDLGFDEEIIDELKKVNEEQKKSPAKKRKKESNK